MTEARCTCSHLARQHNGEVRGPNVDARCEGAGWAGNDEYFGQHVVCDCREYEGPNYCFTCFVELADDADDDVCDGCKAEGKR